MEGPSTLGDGRPALKARVGAPAEDGRANAALIKRLAKSWRLPKGTIAIVAGQSKCLKTLEVAGDAEVFLAHLEAWLRSEAGADATASVTVL